MHLTHVPLRAVTGAYIFNSGVSKLGADEDTANFLHASGAGTYPALFKDMPPKKFAQLLAYSEMAVGAALLVPVVPATLAGAALTGFGASLVGMYFKTPSMTLDDGIRPSQEGIALAKDIWLVGAGLTLLGQGVTGTATEDVEARRGRKPLGRLSRGRK